MTSGRWTLRRLFQTSLILIGAMVVMSGILLYYTTRDQNADGDIINLAGKQRMLSQRIVRLILESELDSNATHRAEALKKLEYSLTELKSAHDLLTENKSFSSYLKRDSLKILNTSTSYFETFSQEVEQVLKGELTDHELAIHQLAIDADYYMNNMDELANQLILDSKIRSELVIRLELAFTILTLFLLIAEYYIVFKPVDAIMADAIEETKKLFDIAPTAIIIVDSDDLSIREINDEGESLLHVSYKEALEMNLSDFIDDEIAKALEHFATHEHEYVLKGLEGIIRNYNRNEVTCLISVGKFVYRGKTHLLIGMADITEQKQSEEVFERLATIDEMTGLYNRRTGLLMMGKEFEKAKRHIYDITMCFIDMDGLKHVNDTFGHAEGDWYIRTVATVLREGIRSGDIGMRFGGDEMVIGFVNCDEPTARDIMERIQKVIDIVCERENKPYDIGISYGLSDYEKDAPMTLESFINYADERMYTVKMKKKNTRV